MSAPNSDRNFEKKAAYRAMFALVIGFFMILMDSTIVSVAAPVIMETLHANVTDVMWVTSAYLLTYAAPLLVTGRLGDRFGQRNVYLFGLVLFTISSLACGLAAWLPGRAITNLIIARGVQGLGASLITPQTMAVITRIFPPNERGIAMGIWGSSAGIAMLFGPILGGVIVGTLGWEWIFMINIPIGVVGYILARSWVPDLPKHANRISIRSIILSVIGMGLLVFGIQEGETYHWGQIYGFITVPMLIVAGLIVLGMFVLLQRRIPEPLMPLSLLRDRNFSLANTAIALVGGGVMAWSLPLMFFLQISLGLPPAEAALMGAPAALFSVFLSPYVGKWVHIVNPKYLAGGGLLITILSLIIYIVMLPMQVATLWYLIPNAILGFGQAAVWGPTSTGATANLEPAKAGAGSGVYNSSRQLGTVVGSAITSVLMATFVTTWTPENVAVGVAHTLWFGVVAMGLAAVAIFTFEPMPTVYKGYKG